jgi:hypothetical protein
MSFRLLTIMALVACLVAPGTAGAAACYDLLGLPEGASISINGLTAPPGAIPLVGEAQGICGIGQPAAAVQGTAIVDASGATRVGLKFLADRPGCTGGEADLLLPPPFTTGSGQVRLPEGSVANVTLAFDVTGNACKPRVPRPTVCIPNSTTLCLLQNRFLVTATATQGSQQVTQLVNGQARNGSSETGFFNFSQISVAGVEVIVKVIDGRGVNGFYWVVVTPTTTVAYTVSVSDTLNGRTKTFVNPIGNPLATVTDTQAFSASP